MRYFLLSLRDRVLGALKVGTVWVFAVSALFAAFLLARYSSPILMFLQSGTPLAGLTLTVLGATIGAAAQIYLSAAIRRDRQRTAIAQWYIGQLNALQNYLVLNTSTLYEWHSVYSSYKKSGEPRSDHETEFLCESAIYQYKFMHEVANVPELLPVEAIDEYASIKSAHFRGLIVILNSEVNRIRNFLAAETYKVEKFLRYRVVEGEIPPSTDEYFSVYIRGRAALVAGLFELCHDAISENNWHNTSLNKFSAVLERQSFESLIEMNGDIEMPKRLNKPRETKNESLPSDSDEDKMLVHSRIAHEGKKGQWRIFGKSAKKKRTIDDEVLAMQRATVNLIRSIFS